MPVLSYLRIRVGSGESKQERVYSLVKNKALTSVAFLMLEDFRLLPEKDTLTVVPGFVGSFPNFFFDLRGDQVADFVRRVIALRGEEDFSALTGTYGVRRSDPDFWRLSDWFYRRYSGSQPVTLT